MAKTAVIVVSDLHINSTVALSLPSINLDDGGTYRASKTQVALWRAWLDFWQVEVPRITKGCKKRVLFLNGDLGELDIHRRSHQLISPNKASILDHIVRVLEPALDQVNSVYVVRGTHAHVGKSAWLEEAIANDLDITVPNNDTQSAWWHYKGLAEKVRFDIVHHATMGRLPWTEANAANKIAKVAIDRHQELGLKPPNVVVRSHNHRYSDSGGNYTIPPENTFAVCTPCWSSMTEFGYRIGMENTPPHIGGVVFICNGDKYEYKRVLYKAPEERRVWSLKI